MAIASDESEARDARAFYSTKEFASIIGVSRGKVYDLIVNGELASLKVGGRRLIPAGEVERLTRMAGFGL